MSAQDFKLTPEAKGILMQASAKAHMQIARSLPDTSNPIAAFLTQFPLVAERPSGAISENAVAQIKAFQDGPLAKANMMSAVFRSNIPKYSSDLNEYRKALLESPTLSKSGYFAKAGMLDVGNLTNFSQITGGQSLGYVSLDTRMARGTIPPQSFTLYNALKKTAAFQIVDYWAYAEATGGPLPGSAFQSNSGAGSSQFYSSVTTGTLPVSAGDYNLKFITLKLALDGRAITVALAAQNSFVDIQEQENTNAALSVLSSIDWACYWGLSGRYSSTSTNGSMYDGQFQGIFGLLTKNVVNFTSWMATQSSSLSQQQGLYNLIYETSADIAGYRNYGKITHAFMSPQVIGDLQSVVTTLLNNIVTNITSFGLKTDGIVVNGDLQGMKTRFGNIQFAIDILINSRNMPAQAIIANNTSQATTVNPTPPSTVVATLSGAAYAGSLWTASYTGASSSYVWAVAAMNATMGESVLTFSNVVTGVTLGSAVTVAVTGANTGDFSIFRVYRSGNGYNLTGSGQNANAFRYIGEILSNGTTAVDYIDINDWIPGSETVFLFDLDEGDDAIDYRYLLPLSRIELFASNMYMPWAVATIGSVRVRIPKFHGAITNYVPDNPDWNPLSNNGF